MEQHKDQFYNLWQGIGRISIDDFDVWTMDAEDLVLAENMVGEGLNRLMELKTRIENAKFRMQTPNLQRGILPQAKEREESVSVETLTDKAGTDKEKTERLIKEFYSQPIELMSRKSSTCIEKAELPEKNKADFGQAEITVGRIQITSAGLPNDTYHLRNRATELWQKSYGSSS